MKQREAPLLRPFQQGRFVDLPEHPHRPHLFFETEAMNISLVSEEWGQMNVYMRRYGQGPPLLLVHGLMTSSYSWRYVFAELGKHFTCYAPDLPAAGRTDAPLHLSYQPQAVARWIGEVQKCLGIRGCPVIANSMGGYLGMQLALLDPFSMSRLVNLHSPGIPEFRLYALRFLLGIVGMKSVLHWLIRRDPWRWVHRHVHYYDETLKSREECREYGEPLRSYAGRQGLIKYLTETMNPRDMEIFQRTLLARKQVGQPFPVPLLLLYADQDPMVPPRFGKILAEMIPDATYIQLSQASHFAHVDATDRFLPPVLAFLKSP